MSRLVDTSASPVVPTASDFAKRTESAKSVGQAVSLRRIVNPPSTSILQTEPIFAVEFMDSSTYRTTNSNDPEAPYSPSKSPFRNKCYSECREDGAHCRSPRCIKADHPAPLEPGTRRWRSSSGTPSKILRSRSLMLTQRPACAAALIRQPLPGDQRLARKEKHLWRKLARKKAWFVLVSEVWMTCS